MKKRYIMILSLIFVILSMSCVSAGLFDGLIGEQQKDNVIEVDHISFNTTNVTKFELRNESEEPAGYYKWYFDENHTGYNVHIWNWSEGFNEPDNPFDWKVGIEDVKDSKINNAPSQTINGIVVYTISANAGDRVGEPRYIAFVENRDAYTIVDFSSPNPNETAKMASTLKFNK